MKKLGIPACVVLAVLATAALGTPQQKTTCRITGKTMDKCCCEMKNGKIYDNAYHFIFTLREGKIAEVLEYCCTYTVVEVFGEYYVPAKAG